MKHVVTLPKDEVVELIQCVKREERTGILIVSFSQGSISGTARWLESAAAIPLDLESLFVVD